MDDERWEPGMPVLDRQPIGVPNTAPVSGSGLRVPVPSAGDLPPSLRVPVPSAGDLPPSLRGLPPRSVPETHPTPLQRHYISLSVIALVCGAVAISALELGASTGSPLVKLCVLVGAPILVATTADAGLRVWRSAWAWMPVDRGRGWFRLSWVVVAILGLAILVAATVVVLAA